MTRFIVSIFFIFTVCGCESEDPNPELKDPVYKDLKGKADSHEKTILENKKRLDELLVALEKTEANSIEQKDVRRDIAKAKETIGNSEQWHRYFKIRAERRAVVDKIAAREAKREGKPWPDPAEYSDYQVNSRLRDAPRNWNNRVPKLIDRLPKKVSEKEAAKQDPPVGGH